MPRRKVDLDTKVQTMRECLHLQDVTAVTHTYGVSERAAFNWFAQILEHLPEILQEAKPGPKSHVHDPAAPPPPTSSLGQALSSAGLFWLKGAFIQLGIDQALLTVLQALDSQRTPGVPQTLRLWHSREANLIAKQHTLAFLSFYKQLRRPRHLDGYNDIDLGLLSDFGSTYRAATIERHLHELSRVRVSQPWGQALARNYWRTWYRDGHVPDSHVFYLDAHEKLLWTQQPVAKGFVSARHEVHTCLKQFYLHGRGGHVLYCETHSGDAHLSEHLLPIIEAFEQAVGQPVVHVLVTDREGLSAEVFEQLHRRKKALITLLRANQYTSEADFERRGRFLNLRDPRTGLVTHRVADADFWFTETLCVRCALVYDLERPEHLIVVVTTLSRHQEPDSRRIVHWYLARWDIQENCFRALEAFMPLDLNFGVKRKQPVPNRPVLARIAELTAHLQAVEHKIESKLRQRAEQPQRMERQMARHDQKMSTWLQRQTRLSARGQGEQLAQLQTEMTEYRARHHKRLSRYLARQRELEEQIETHQQEQTRALQELAALDPQAPFFDVDTETDQLVTHLRIAVYNSTLFTRERYFGAAYQRTTPFTLWRLFFSQDGYYREDAEGIYVTLKPFRDANVHQAAHAACERFNRERITTANGQIIHMAVADCI